MYRRYWYWDIVGFQGGCVAKVHYEQVEQWEPIMKALRSLGDWRLLQGAELPEQRACDQGIAKRKHEQVAQVGDLGAMLQVTVLLGTMHGTGGRLTKCRRMI